MNRWSIGAAALVACMTTMGCTSSRKEMVPVARSAIALRVPHQQKLLALSVEQAVERLNFQGFAGRKFKVEVNGVLPHTKEDLLDYIRSAVELRLAQAGAIVVDGTEKGDDEHASLISPMAPQLTQNLLGFPQGDPGAAPQPPVPEPSPPDTLSRPAPPVAPAPPRLPANPDGEPHRLIVGVSWGGMDTTVRHVTRPGPYVVATLVPVGIVGAGVGATAGVAAADGEGATAIPPIVATTGLIAFLIAYIAATDFSYDTYTLTGNVRLNVAVIPANGEITAQQTTTEGKHEVVIDPTDDVGYRIPLGEDIIILNRDYKRDDDED